MNWPCMDVYEFIKKHDEANHLDYYDEPSYFNERKHDLAKFIVLEKKRDELDDFTTCDDCEEFCEKRRSDFDAIKDIRGAIRVIHEALRDIEKNRICEGIRDIEEGIRDTKEGVNDIIRSLNIV